MRFLIIIGDDAEIPSPQTRQSGYKGRGVQGRVSRATAGMGSYLFYMAASQHERKDHCCNKEVLVAQLLLVITKHKKGFLNSVE